MALYECQKCGKKWMRREVYSFRHEFRDKFHNGDGCPDCLKETVEEGEK